MNCQMRTLYEMLHPNKCVAVNWQGGQEAGGTQLLMSRTCTI